VTGLQRQIVVRGEGACLAGNIVSSHQRSAAAADNLSALLTYRFINNGFFAAAFAVAGSALFRVQVDISSGLQTDIAVCNNCCCLAGEIATS